MPICQFSFILRGYRFSSYSTLLLWCITNIPSALSIGELYAAWVVAGTGVVTGPWVVAGPPMVAGNRPGTGMVCSYMRRSIPVGRFNSGQSPPKTTLPGNHRWGWCQAHWPFHQQALERSTHHCCLKQKASHCLIYL